MHLTSNISSGFGLFGLISAVAVPASPQWAEPPLKASSGSSREHLNAARQYANEHRSSSRQTTMTYRLKSA